ncbi:MAG: Type 1 glutamine amidotransferase-like domain-containing protein [Oscillospiraceae bacterium]|nr:Type 1 glutamine amidotransferase-like domain-containing protein [Oscillospiraceae bacterium]
MILFLSSSPCVPNADRAILNPANGFVDRLRAVLPESPKCLVVCSDPEGWAFTDRFAEEMEEAFAEADIPFRETAVLDPRSDDSAQELIWESDLIILCGGHVPTQNAYFQEIGLAELMENYQGVVLGISAGSMNCADEVYIQPEEPGESDPEFQRFAPGLGLTDTNILPHYQQVKDNILDGLRLFEDITYADSMGRCFLAMVDGTYIYNDGEGELLFGEAYTLEDGVMEQISEENDITLLW